MFNECTFIGHMGNDARITTTDNGRMVAQLSLACTTRGYKKADGTEVPERTEWIPIVVWGKLAETIKQYTHKGSKLFIQGEWRNRSYEKDGVTRYISECYASKVVLLDKRENGVPLPPDPEQTPTTQTQNNNTYTSNAPTQQPMEFNANQNQENELPF